MARFALTLRTFSRRPARGTHGLLIALLLVTTGSAFAQTTLRPDGAPIRLIGDEASAFAHPVWSPDGTRLTLTRPGFTGLWTVRPDGEDLRFVTDDPAAGFGASWSPDGTALLARVARPDGPRRAYAVRVYDLGSGTSEDLTDYRTQMPTLPRWSPDGTAVLLPTEDGIEVFERVAAAPVRPVQSERPTFVARGTTLSAIRTDAGSPDVTALLTDQRIINVAPSPDYDRVAFEVVGGNLHVVNADGSGLLDLGPGHRPAWSPDGQWIAFMRTQDDGERFTAADLWAARADGSAVVALTQTPEALEMNPSWSPDGTSIAFDDLRDGAVYLLPIAR